MIVHPDIDEMEVVGFEVSFRPSIPYFFVFCWILSISLLSYFSWLFIKGRLINEVLQYALVVAYSWVCQFFNYSASNFPWHKPAWGLYIGMSIFQLLCLWLFTWIVVLYLCIVRFNRVPKWISIVMIALGTLVYRSTTKLSLLCWFLSKFLFPNFEQNLLQEFVLR